MSAPTNVWQELDAELIPRLTAVGFRAIDFPAKPPTETKGA